MFINPIYISHAYWVNGDVLRVLILIRKSTDIIIMQTYRNIKFVCMYTLNSCKLFICCRICARLTLLSSDSSTSSCLLCNYSVPLLSEGFSKLCPHRPIVCYLLPDGTLLVVIQFVSPPSRRSSSRSFPFVRFPAND